MPVYKDNAQNRKLGRVGKSWGKEAPKKSAPVKKASKKAAGGSNPVGFYEVLTTHKDYIDSANATMDKIEKSKISEINPKNMKTIINKFALCPTK